MDELDSDVRPSGAVRFFIAAMLALMLYPRPAEAHAFPTSEEPMVGATVETSPRQVAITFDSPIEELFAKIEVSDASGQDETDGVPKVGGDHRQLSVLLKPLKAGDYTVKWSVVAEDSHRTEGSFQFTVAGGSQ
jgi:copper resistance protein C